MPTFRATASRAVLLVLALALAALAACGGPSGPGGGSGSGPGGGPSASATSTPEPKPLLLGLDTALTGPTATTSDAIRRGIELAIDELNGQGGVRGRNIQLVVRDNEGDQAKAVANLRELVEVTGVVAVFGGPSSTLTAAELDTIHQLRIPYILTYASGTRLVQNGRQPNFVFRVGPSDATAGQAVATYLGKNLAKRKPTVIAEESLWSDSAAQGIGTGMTGAGLKVAGVEKLGSGSVDGAALGRALDGAGADSVVLVADPASGLRTVEALTQRDWNATSKPIVAAWGLSPAQPPQPEKAPPNGVSVLQTYSFWGELSIPGKRLSSGYQRKYGGSSPADVLAPSAVADGFDATHIVVRALREVPDPDDSDMVRQALENLQTPYEGVIKNYQRPFAPNQHEALGPEDYTIVTWRDGQAQNERPTGR